MLKRTSKIGRLKNEYFQAEFAEILSAGFLTLYKFFTLWCVCYCSAKKNDL